MKRKIAILLSAMMVTSAMPISASAAQLKGDTLLNAGFPKADKTIDPNYTLGLEYQDGKVVTTEDKGKLSVDDLKNRQSVLKIKLDNVGTSGNIDAGTTFKITLENGKFDTEKANYYQYLNTTNGKAVDYNTAMYGETKNSDSKKMAKSLAEVYANISNANKKIETKSYGWNLTSMHDLDTLLNSEITEGVASKYENGTYIGLLRTLRFYREISKHDGTEKSFDELGLKEAKYVDFKAKYESGNEKITIKVNNEVLDGINQIATDQDETGETFVKVYNAINDEDFATLNELKEQMQKELNMEVSKGNSGISLPYIPYILDIENETTANITIPVALTDSDTKVSISSSKRYKFNKPEDVILTEDNASNNIGGNNKQKFSVTNLKEVKKVSLGVNSSEDTSMEIKDSYIALPLGAVVAESDAPVKVNIDGNYNDKVISGSYTLTKNEVNGSTSLSYPKSSVKKFEDYTTLDNVILRENVRDTIGKTNDKNKAEIVVRLSGGFKFKNLNEVVTGKEGKKGSNYSFIKDNSNNIADWNNVTIIAEATNDSTIKFTLEGLGTNRKRPIGFSFNNLQVEPTNERNFGEVTLSISGDGISSQDVVVAQREGLGFKLETMKDPQDIIVGRHYEADKKTMLEKDNQTVEIKFSEAIPNTLVESRNLDFTVPEGVKIVDADIYNDKNFTGLGENDFEIVNQGRTLRLKADKTKKGATSPDVYKVTDKLKAAEFKMKLDLSIDPAFEGDIKLGVTGGGESKVVETIIAKAKKPFEIKTISTKANLGYQDYDTADIVITETKPGMFLEGQTATLSLVAPYGTNELGFSAAKYEVTGGEMEVKDRSFKVGEYKEGNSTTKGAISFDINRASYKNPSTITIKDVKIGATRSVPYGVYDLALGGKAVINNYESKVEDNKKFDLNQKPMELVKQSGHGSFVVKNYVDIVTATGTLDEVVKVTIGEKTVMIGNKAVDMGVAPYIQPTSNSTMVPLRFVSLALGVDNVENADGSDKISFDPNTKTATIFYGAGTGQKIIQFQAGSNIMNVDGNKIAMEYGVKAEIKDQRMFVPFRALGTALGVDVQWDENTKTAIYNQDNGRNRKTSETTTMMSSTTTTMSTTASSTESTTMKDSTTQTTTMAKDSTTETTTAK